jgi:L-iditol 2-dehydrogenase
MLAVVKTEQIQEVIVQEIEKPKLEDGEVLIKVDYCGICGSDLHAFNHAPGYEFVQMPRVLGHEVTGTVVEVSNPEFDHLLDQRVITESIQYCGNCPNCIEGKTHICENFQVMGLHFDGGMGQYAKCAARFVQVIPEDFPVRLAALVEPMAIAVHAVESIARVKPGENILVQGPGIIGFFTGLACLEAGAKVTLSGLPTDVQARLSHASRFGMDTHVVGESPQPPQKVIFSSNARVRCGPWIKDYNPSKRGGKR